MNATPPQPLFRATLGPGEWLDFDRAFLVEEGDVELYGVAPTGRRFVASFAKGRALFGGAPALALRIFAAEGARLAALPEAALADGLAKSETRAAVAQALDAFVETTSRGLGRLAGVRPEAVAATAGQRRAIAAGQRLSPALGVVWLFPDEGCELRLVGIGEPIARPLPVAAGTWAEAAQSGVIEVLSTAALLERDWRAAAASFSAAVAAAALALASRDAGLNDEAFARRQATTEARLADSERQWLSALSHAEAEHAAMRDDLDYAVAMAIGVPSLLGPATLARREGQTTEAWLDERRVLSRPVTLADEPMRADHGALLAFLVPDGKPVALVPNWRGRYVLRERGRRPRRLGAALAKRLERRAYAVAPALPDRSLKARDVALIAFSLARADFLVIAAAGVLAALLGLITPVAARAVMDMFVPDALVGDLALVGVALGLANLGSTLLRTASDLTRLRIDGRLAQTLSSGALDRTLRLPSRLLQAQASADLAFRLMSIDQNRRALSDITSSLVIAGASSLSTLALLIYYAPLAGAAAAALFAAFLAIAVFAGVAQNRALAPREAASANVANLTLQIVRNMPVLRAFGAERHAYAQWTRSAAQQRTRSFRSRVVGVRFETFIAAYDGLALAAIFVALAWSTRTQAASIGVYFAFIAAFQQFLASGEMIGRSLVQWIGMQPSLKRAALILETPPEPSRGIRLPEGLSGAVEFASVSFRHTPLQPFVLDRVSFRVEPGQFVAIVGPSGSGKTTLVNMILGLERPDAGAVLIDGVDLARLDRSWVRRQIGVVRQNARLAPGSILDNLTGLSEAKLDDVWAAAEEAAIADELRALPMGMHTLVTEGGSAFSGGQAQRLMLARALLAKPRLLLLDEATSALDGATQAKVMANIERLGVTRIVVAHRLSTVRSADVIHFFAGGRIVQSGRYDDLLKSGGPFAAFAHRQVPT